jgi:hypothetical protein
MTSSQLATIVLFLVVAVASMGITDGATTRNSASKKKKSLCDRLHPEELPQECICREAGNLHVVVDCIKPFNSTFFNDTIGMSMDIDICNESGSSVTVDVTEKNHHIDFPIEAIRAGEEKNIPIPGLSIIVPAIGSFGVDATVLIAGNPDHLTMKIGLNACLSAGHHREICASSIPGLNTIFPFYFINGTYSFGHVCDTDNEHFEQIGDEAQAIVR